MDFIGVVCGEAAQTSNHLKNRGQSAKSHPNDVKSVEDGSSAAPNLKKLGTTNGPCQFNAANQTHLGDVG